MSSPNTNPIPCSLNQEEIVNFAEELAALFEVTSGNDLRGIVKKLGGTIEDLPCDALADARATISIIKGTPPKFTIRLAKSLFPSRDRFCIAHELGHLFLHSQLGKYAVEAAHNEYSATASLAEKQANSFAYAFLIPGSNLQSDADELKTRLDDLAVEFNVPRQIMVERVKLHTTLGHR